jgi:hypothetical protein
MCDLKTYDNEKLIDYFLKVLEMIKNPFLVEKEFRKLMTLFNNEKILKL